ncbi:MAG: phosphate signaling complex protein PhoU [Bacteroidota bacterium]|jgi:phosphate transport system protein
MHEHIVKSYESELSLLDKKVVQMGGLAEQLLGQAFEALERRNPKLAETAIASDAAIDQLQRELEEQAISMIARRQPLALDLRQIMAALKVAADLERVGDFAKNIAKRALAVSGETHPKTLMTGLRHMTELALRQLKDVLDAFAARDAKKALEVWRNDEQIDALYNSVFRELLTYMMEDPRNIGLCTHLLFGAKNIERIGDHATNVAETVHYLVTGQPLTDDRPKGDKTSTTLIGTGSTE